MDSRKPPAIDLPPEIKANELRGMRVIVVRNEETGEVAPARVIRGEEFPDYESFMAKVNQTLRELSAEVRGSGWSVEDAWARSIDDFMHNYPELVPTIWR